MSEWKHMTINTKTIRGAHQAIAMRRNGWELVEVKDFWIIKFRRKKPKQTK